MNNDYSDLEQHITNVFSSPGSLNASFLKVLTSKISVNLKKKEYLDTSESVTGLDLAAVRETYLKLLSLVSNFNRLLHALLFLIYSLLLR
jgi:hypothetical protein